MKYLKPLLLLAVIAASGFWAFMHLAPSQALSAVMVAERAAAGLERKTIVLDSGERLVYLEGGKGAPLMLVHGFGANKDHFVRVARDLTSHHRVIIPDLLGFGESERPPTADYSPTAQAERLRKLAAALGVLEGLDLGGSSMGGQIAMSWAAKYPDEVKSLWLLDPAGIWSAPKSEMQRSYERSGKMPLIVESEEDFLALTRWSMSKPPFAPEPLLRALAHESLPYKELSTKILLSIRGDSLESRIAGLQTPALIVWGTEDRLVSPQTAEVLHRLLPKSEVIMMKGIGHLPNMEAPHLVAQDYLAFRRR